MTTEMIADTPGKSNEADEDKSYILNSDQELDRLRINHRVYKTSMNGSLVFAPLDLSNATNGVKILDSATADGTWLRDFASSLPADIRDNSTFVGTDLIESYLEKARSVTDTTTTSGNVQYLIQDINKPWPAELHGTFDLVHQRLGLAGSAAGGPDGIPTAIARLIQLVKPGGYIQLFEAENIIDDDDGPAMHEFIEVIKTVFGMIGLNPTFMKDGLVRNALEEAGVVDIQDELVSCYFGRNAKMQQQPNEKWIDEMTWAMKVGTAGLVGIIKCEY